jgi:hypothetical protein
MIIFKPKLRMLYDHTQSIFQSLNGFDIESFISFWDFLNKRFFFHLDTEHLNLSGILKTDLVKYYLVNAIKTKNKEKVTEFFAAYSHEILAESGNFIPGNFRSWFVLPYIDEPEKDTEFSAYFGQRWSDLLKVTLHNFLSVVLSSAPPPKLLLIEKWFRSEAQQEIRAQLKLSSKKIDSLIGRIEQQEDRLQSLRETVQILATLLCQTISASIAGAAAAASANANGGRSSYSSGGGGGGGGGGYNTMSSEQENEAESKRFKGKAFGMEVSRIAVNCLKKSASLQSLPREERLAALLGREVSDLLRTSGYRGAGAGGEASGAVREGSGGGGVGELKDGMQEGKQQQRGQQHSSKGGEYDNMDTPEWDLEYLEGELVSTVHDWASILS